MCAGVKIVMMFMPPNFGKLGDGARGPSRHPYVPTRYGANSEPGLVVNAAFGELLQHPCAPRLDSVDVAHQPVYCRHEFRGDEHRQAVLRLRQEGVRRFGLFDVVGRQHLRLAHVGEDALEQDGETPRFGVISGDGRLALRSRKLDRHFPDGGAGRP
jgi:hypothetical protein